MTLIGLVINNPISWSSKKQQTVSRSSTEAKYRALSFTSAKLDWIKQLLAFLHVQLLIVPVLFCDNLFAIALSFNPVQHQKTKHIKIDGILSMKECARNNSLCSLYLHKSNLLISSQKDWVDHFFKLIVAILCLDYQRISLRGDVRV